MGKAARFLLLLAGRFGPLLDQFSGAAAAYSLRSLRYSTTNVVKVRRSGDDAELDFTASDISNGTLASWVTAGGGTEDGFVTTWYDQSGNTNNATQATAANQPKIVSSGSLVTENGKAAMDFDGVNDSLATTGYIVELSANNATVLAVVNPIDDKYILSEADAIPPLYSSNFILGGPTASNLTLWVNATTFGSAITGQTLVGFTYNGTNFQAYQNGATDGASGSATVNAEVLNKTVIGSRADQSTEFYEGKIQELITYKSDQSAKRTGIEANINDYYNIYP